MIDIVNPYNILAFYSSNTDRAQECVLYAPPKLLPFQIPVSSIDANFSFDLVDLDGNEYSPSSGSLTVNEYTDGTKYVTFLPTVDEIATDGIYQIKFTSNLVEYWSNAICVKSKYKAIDGVSVSCIGNSASYVITLTPNNKADYTTFQIDFGEGYVMRGQDSAQISLTDVGVGLSFTLPVKATFVYGNDKIENIYNLSYAAADPCGTASLVLVSSTSSANYSSVYVEFWHNSDVADKNLIFQNNYKQRFYFDAEYAFPTRVQEESFISSYDNTLTLESASEADQVNIDFYPMPDYLLTALGQARFFDNCNLVDINTGNFTALQNFNLTANTAEGSLCQSGRITSEINRSFISSCQTNKTPV